MENKRGLKTRLWAMALGMVALTTSFTAAAEMQGTVIATQGIVRESGNFDGEVLNTLSIGTKVTVLEVVDQWYRIKAEENDVEGWMFKDIVSVGEEASKMRTGEVTADILNVRLEPNTASEIMKKLSKGATVSIVGESAGWYQIVLSGTLTGWVSGEYVQVIPNYPKASVVEEAASLFTEKTGTTILRALKQGETVYIKGYEDGYFQVLTEDNLSGWVKSQGVELILDSPGSANRSASRTGVFGNLEEVTKKYLGKPYSWGKTGPNAFDCSGFTTYILKTYYSDYLKSRGIDLPRTSSGQATVGTPVAKADLQPGDLVFFNTTARRGSNITHVGIYLGGGQFVHASSSKARVIISSLSEGYYSTRYIKAVRL